MFGLKPFAVGIEPWLVGLRALSVKMMFAGVIIAYDSGCQLLHEQSDSIRWVTTEEVDGGEGGSCPSGRRKRKFMGIRYEERSRGRSSPDSGRRPVCKHNILPSSWNNLECLCGWHDNSQILSERKSIASIDHIIHCHWLLFTATWQWTAFSPTLLHILR